MIRAIGAPVSDPARCGWRLNSRRNGDQRSGSGVQGAPKTRGVLSWFWAAALALGLCGCAGYRLGPMHPELTSGKTIQVNFFENRTLEPRLVEAVNRALRKSLQQDGSYKLNTRGDGDVIVNGTVLRYERQGVSFQPNDILTVRDYQVTLTVKVTATERTSGKVVFDREVTGRTTVRVGSDLASADRQALPLLADDFARKATTLLLEGTW